MIELLVVVALIVMLISLLLPSLDSVRDSARRAICSSNMSQIQKQLHMFRSDPKGDRQYALPGSRIWLLYVGTSGAGDATVCPSDTDATGRGLASPSNILAFGGDSPSNIKYNGNFENSGQTFIFLEREAYVLPSAVNVDISQPGYYPTYASMTPSTIPAGTMVDVLFTHYDAYGSANSRLTGTFSVGGDILGIICRDASLNATDATIGLPGTQYSTGMGARGFENGGQDPLTLHDDWQTLTVDFTITSPGEEMRIFVRGGTGGGISSYGMNNQVEAKTGGRGGQVLLLDYEKSIVDFDYLDGPNDDPDDWLAPRHAGKCNVLFVDGSVQVMAPEELDPQKSIWKADPRDGIP